MTKAEFKFGNRFIKQNMQTSQTLQHTSIETINRLSPQPRAGSSSLHYAKSKISTHHITLTFNEIRSERIARMTGLISHFVYWIVFGNVNLVPLDEYHTKQLFISVAQSMTELTSSYSNRKTLFNSFVMPMILLAIRVEMEVMLKSMYRRFMSVKENETQTMRLVNGVITELLDPNVFYSRFSFLESGKDALDIKLRLHQKGKKQDSKSKFYTRSALVKNLIPNPSEGRVRKLFCGYRDTSRTQLTQQSSSILSQAAQKSVFGLNRKLSPLNHESSAAYQQ